MCTASEKQKMVGLGRLRRKRLPLLVHYHIFKNAGTSFEWALEQTLGPAYTSFDTASPRGFISGRDLKTFIRAHPSIRAVSSHQTAPPAPRIKNREVFTSILIRDPIARIRSIYAFERLQTVSSPGAVRAKELNFREYIEWRLEATPSVLCNYQVNFCIRSKRPLSFPVGPEHLEQAIARLDDISIVGTVARYDEWIALAQKILSAPLPDLHLQSICRNATTLKETDKKAVFKELVRELGNCTTRYLLEQNELDMCLHQVADSLLTRKLAEYRVSLVLAGAYQPNSTLTTPGESPAAIHS